MRLFGFCVLGGFYFADAAADEEFYVTSITSCPTSCPSLREIVEPNTVEACLNGPDNVDCEIGGEFTVLEEINNEAFYGKDYIRIAAPYVRRPSEGIDLSIAAIRLELHLQSDWPMCKLQFRHSPEDPDTDQNSQVLDVVTEHYQYERGYSVYADLPGESAHLKTLDIVANRDIEYCGQVLSFTYEVVGAVTYSSSAGSVFNTGLAMVRDQMEVESVIERRRRSPVTSVSVRKVRGSCPLDCPRKQQHSSVNAITSCLQSGPKNCKIEGTFVEEWNSTDSFEFRDSQGLQHMVVLHPKKVPTPGFEFTYEKLHMHLTVDNVSKQDCHVEVRSRTLRGYNATLAVRQVEGPQRVISELPLRALGRRFNIDLSITSGSEPTSCGRITDFKYVATGTMSASADVEVEVEDEDEDESSTADKLARLLGGSDYEPRRSYFIATNVEDSCPKTCPREHEGAFMDLISYCLGTAQPSCKLEGLFENTWNLVDLIESQDSHGVWHVRIGSPVIDYPWISNHFDSIKFGLQVEVVDISEGPCSMEVQAKILHMHETILLEVMTAQSVFVELPTESLNRSFDLDISIKRGLEQESCGRITDLTYRTSGKAHFGWYMQA